jgi:hypothetical protein
MINIQGKCHPPMVIASDKSPTKTMSVFRLLIFSFDPELFLAMAEQYKKQKNRIIT